MPMKSYVLIAHGDGISVGGDGFRNYSIGSGRVSGQAVATADENWFFATDGGLLSQPFRVVVRTRLTT